MGNNARGVQIPMIDRFFVRKGLDSKFPMITPNPTMPHPSKRKMRIDNLHNAIIDVQYLILNMFPMNNNL